MRTFEYITLWHQSNGGYEKKFHRARCFREERFAKSGMHDSGFHSGSRGDVRIPLREKPVVQLGDYVSLGKSKKDAPDRINDLKVMRISENLRGANPHIKLFIGRASERG